MPAARQRPAIPQVTAPASALEPVPAPPLLELHDRQARDAALAGAKAASLATAAAHGLPVLPGFVVTTAAGEGGAVAPPALDALQAAWAALAVPVDRPLVVRSSSTVEDSTTSSMAGQFTSVLGVRGWPGFVEAVGRVLASAAHPGDATTTKRPMAVLVQPQVDAVCGGVLFGLDPVTGDRDHVIVEAVPGMPDVLVSGTATAVHVVLGRHGRLVGGAGRTHAALLTGSRRRRLARLAQQAATVFDGPQDVEWAFDRDDRLWLLQSRPVTAAGSVPPGRGPILGPGPVAETFPDPLRPLEIALWVDPLRAGVTGAIRATGAVGRRRLDESPVVTTVGGRVAADLELFGIVPAGHGLLRVLNPVRGLRRLVAAWSVGRLRAAMPALAGDLIAGVDAELVAVGDPAELGDDDLLDLLRRATELLVALHGHEVLAGMLRPADGDRSSAAGLASAALGRGRADGLADDALVARYPVTLALLPPSIGDRRPLPPSTSVAAPVPLASITELGCREGLRLRCRWVQELTAQVGRELGCRLVRRGVLDRIDLVAELTLDELEAALVGGRVPRDLAARMPAGAGPPLPMAFRLSPDAVPVPVTVTEQLGGLPASAGRVSGLACGDPGGCTAGEPCVLVVDVLDPRLAPVLPTIIALVSESGSALSHLAILARELRVPAVVAVPDARRRFPAGTRLLVDGTTGEVRSLDVAEEQR